MWTFVLPYWDVHMLEDSHVDATALSPLVGMRDTSVMHF